MGGRTPPDKAVYTIQTVAAMDPVVGDGGLGAGGNL